MHKQVREADSKGPTFSYKEATKSNSGICRPASFRMTFPWVGNTKMFSTKLYSREKCIHHQYDMYSSAVDPNRGSIDIIYQLKLLNIYGICSLFNSTQAASTY